MFDVDYYVNKEKKVVVAKMTGCGNGLAYDMCRKGYPPISAFEIANAFIGKAKCSPDDTFDEETGKKIAFKRAYKKYVMAKKKAVAAFLTENNKLVDEFNDTVKNLMDSYDRADAHRTEEIKPLLTE